jgi:hypothetical protein
MDKRVFELLISNTVKINYLQLTTKHPIQSLVLPYNIQDADIKSLFLVNVDNLQYSDYISILRVKTFTKLSLQGSLYKSLIILESISNKDTIKKINLEEEYYGENSKIDVNRVPDKCYRVLSQFANTRSFTIGTSISKDQVAHILRVLPKFTQLKKLILDLIMDSDVILYILSEPSYLENIEEIKISLVIDVNKYEEVKNFLSLFKHFKKLDFLNLTLYECQNASVGFFKTLFRTISKNIPTIKAISIDSYDFQNFSIYDVILDLILALKQLISIRLHALSRFDSEIVRAFLKIYNPHMQFNISSARRKYFRI